MGDAALLCNWWNHPELLDDFCDAVAGEAWSELLVVDNASEPETARLLAERIPALGGRVLRREENGQTAGNHLAVAESRASCLVFLNSDVRARRPGWLAELLAALRPGRLCGAAAQVKDEVRYLEGWCLALARRDWERLGGFDPVYEEPPYWNDVDLSWRAEQLGLRLHVVPVALAHKGSGSTRGLITSEGFWDGWHRNRARFLAKLAAAGDPRGHPDAPRSF